MNSGSPLDRSTIFLSGFAPKRLTMGTGRCVDGRQQLPMLLAQANANTDPWYPHAIPNGAALVCGRMYADPLSGTTLRYHSSTTVLTLGTMIPSRTSPAMLFLPSRPAGSSSPIAVLSGVKQ